MGLFSVFKRKKTAIVFTGGGSKGAVQVGMLRELLKSGVKPDFCVGTSVGAMNAAYFCGNPTIEGLDELEKLWTEIETKDIFPLSARVAWGGLFGNRKGVVKSDGLQTFIASNASYQNLEDAKIPCHILAANILNGSEICFSSGSVVDAVYASSSIPGLFEPVEYKNQYLVDGGIVANAPIATAFAKGATEIFVLPTAYACELKAVPEDAIGVLSQSINLMMMRQFLMDLMMLRKKADIRVLPPVCTVKAPIYDFSATEQLIHTAEESTRSWVKNGGLKSTSLPPDFLITAEILDQKNTFL